MPVRLATLLMVCYDLVRSPRRFSDALVGVPVGEPTESSALTTAPDGKLAISRDGRSQPQPPLGPQHQAYPLTAIKKWGGLGAGHALGPELERCQMSNRETGLICVFYTDTPSELQETEQRLRRGFAALGIAQGWKNETGNLQQVTDAELRGARIFKILKTETSSYSMAIPLLPQIFLLPTVLR